jgi:hypothetical protein
MHASLFICKGLVQHLLPLLFPLLLFFPYYHRCWMLNRPRFFLLQHSKGDCETQVDGTQVDGSLH